MSQLRVQIASRSDLGRVRTENEDSILHIDLEGELRETVDCVSKRGPLLLVCDGMGGRAGGDIASRTACTVIGEQMRAASDSDDRLEVGRALQQAFQYANAKIRVAARKDKNLRGMGTTASALALAGDTAVVGQVGDSRAYLLRRGVLSQLTRDQSVVSAMVRAGHMSERQAQSSMQKGRILQALGTAPTVDVSVSVVELRADDRILLCSDGLYECLSDREISDGMAVEELEGAVASLVGLALERGGNDNISVILAHFEGDKLREAGSDEGAVAFAEMQLRQGSDELRTTSMVRRRLAHKAGIVTQKSIPIQSEAEVEGRAGQLLREASSLGRMWWWLVLALLLGLGATLWLLA